MFRNRTLVALAALVVIGGATIWKVTRPDPHAAGPAGEPGAAVYHVAKADIDEIEITDPKKGAVDLKKDGGEWKVTAPVADRADQKAVEQALDALDSLKLKQVVAEKPESYDTVGVKDEDVVKVVPKKAGKPLATLLLGKTTNARVEGDPRVFATANLRRFALVKETKLWRDRTIVEMPGETLDHVAVAYPNGQTVVVGKEAAPPPEPAPDKDAKPLPKSPDKWVVKDGQAAIGGGLDESLPGGIGSALTRLEADDFVETPDLPAEGLDKPRTTVTAFAKDGSSKTLLIGKDDGQITYVMLKDGTRVWKAHKYDADKFPTSAIQWRDKVFLKLDPALVTKVEIEQGKDKTILARVDDKTWKAVAPADLGELDGQKVTAFLRPAQYVKATRIAEGVDPKAAGLDKPRAVVTFWKKDGSSVKLSIGASKANETTVALSGSKDLYVCTDYSVSGFLKSPKDLKKSNAPTAAAK